jgi:hypothetical protein
MDVGAEGQRHLYIYDASGTGILGLGQTKEGNSATIMLGGGKAKSFVGLQSESGDKKGGFFYIHDGKVTARLGEAGLVMYNDAGKKATEVWVKGVAVYDKAEKRIARFGADPKTEFGSLVIGKDGKALAGVSIEKEAGLIVVRDSNNESLVELGEPGVQVFNKGKSVGRLGLSPSGKGSGYLSIGNPAGNTIVEAGMLEDGDGVVRAYPLTGRTPVPIPNFIRGGKK